MWRACSAVAWASVVALASAVRVAVAASSRAEVGGTSVMPAKLARPPAGLNPATIRRGADLPDKYVWYGTPPGRGGPATGMAPAVTVVVTKLAGTNAADITHAIERRLREWQGVDYIVTVTTDGFEWQGRPYKSLSAIARAITGTRWNGWVFFGLKNHRGRR